MVAIIFGANGQDGYYLGELLRANGIEVTGTSRSGSFTHVDVGNYQDVKNIITSQQPDMIFHLAANSTTRHDALFENHAAVSTGAFNILESVKKYAPYCKVFLSGSGLQFVNNGLPIKETDPFEGSSPYSVSRIQSVYAARYYRTLGLKAYVGYFFNHESPRRPERHMSKMIACAAKRIGAGSDEKITIGDITVKKEWAYAGDVVKGVLTLVQQDEVFEATIGSGLAYSIEDWLNECFGIVGKDWKQHVIKSDNFIPEYNILVSDPTTLNGLGWQPEISFSSLAQIMITEP